MSLFSVTQLAYTALQAEALVTPTSGPMRAETAKLTAEAIQESVARVAMDTDTEIGACLYTACALCHVALIETCASVTGGPGGRRPKVWEILKRI
jgi:cytochrome c2